MSKVLNTQEMYYCDNYTCEQEKISSMELMRRAGLKLAKCIRNEYNLNIVMDKIIILCGIGNNGGDALIVGKELMKDNYDVKFVVVGDISKLSNDLLTMYIELDEITDIIYVREEADLEVFRALLNESTLLVDGLFGIGLNREVDGINFSVIDEINKSNIKIFSIDIPSGIMGNSGKIAGIAIKADITGIVQTPKLGNLLNDAIDYHGKKIVLDIGIKTDIVSSNRLYIDSAFFKDKLKKRVNNTHKYHYGNVLVIGGSLGMTGAPILSGRAALRSGAGLVTISISEHYLSYVSTAYPEIMIKPYQEMSTLLNKKDVITFGPGLGRVDDINSYILKQLINSKLPLVIDADGLYYLKVVLNHITDGSNIIITPHVGELALLLDVEQQDIQHDPVKYVEHVTNKYGFTVLLKGPSTIVANKDALYIGNFGNPGMATAGSGDVLTGIIAALIGQGLSIIDAGLLGAYLHGLAGNYAKELMGEYSMIASDIIDNLPKAFRTVMTE